MGKKSLYEVRGMRTFTGRALDQIVFPLGGVGTGTIGLHGTGRLVDWEIFNAPNKETEAPATGFMIRVKEKGKPGITKVLASRRMPPYVSHHGGTKYHYTPYQFAGLPHLASAAFTGEYPFANIVFKDDSLPVSVRLSAFNPMVPHELDSSSIPAVAFVYTVKNKTRRPISVSIGGTILNMVGLSAPETFVRKTARAFPSNTRFELFGSNVNSRIEGKGYAGLHMGTKKYRQFDPGFGSMALITNKTGSSVRTEFPDEAWFDVMDYLWRDFSSDGKFDHAGTKTKPSPDKKSYVGGVSSSVNLKPREEKDILFILSWYFPNVPVYWDTFENAPIKQRRQFYAKKFRNAKDAAQFLFINMDQLKQQSLRYINTLKESTLPWHVVEAVANCASIIRTNTVQIFDDGFVHCFEGTDRFAGCCKGTCTHVWNYAHTMAYLYPELERNCRETSFLFDTKKDGSMHFRTRRSSGCNERVYTPAADGQMGSLIRLYREWQLSGNSKFLKKLWPGAKRAMKFAWKRWDRDRDGVMECLQHNTYDIEFAGPNTLVGTYYLGALQACSRMAEAVGDRDFSEICRKMYERGRKKYLTLWKDEYFVQKYDRKKAVKEAKTLKSFARLLYKPSSLKGKEDVKYQYGKGCLADQVIGDWQSREVGLGGVLQNDKVKKTLGSIFKYNFRENFADFESVQRIYVLNEDAGLIICTWPKGGRPELPFVYSDEVWTGIEYQVAAHCAYMGLLDECLTITKAARDRHDGIRRNPFNDVECGDHYARALASYSILNALLGFEYSAVEKHMGFSPKVNKKNFSSFYASGRSWGRISIKDTEKKVTVKLDILSGDEELKTISIGTIKKAKRVSCSIGKDKPALNFETAGRKLVITFNKKVKVKQGDCISLTVL